MKLRVKIVISFLLVAFVSAVFSFFITRYFSKGIIIELIGNYNTLIAQESANSIDLNIYSRLERWESYINGNSELQTVLSVSNSEFDKMDERDNYIKNQDETWKKTSPDETTDFIKAILNNSISSGLRDRINFYAGKYGYDIFPEVFITNKYGVNIAQNIKTSDYNQSDELWWQRAKNEGIYVSDVIYDDSSNVQALELCFRIDDFENNFLGIVKVVYNIKDIFQIVDKIAQEQSDSSNTDYFSNFSRKTVDAILLSKKGELIYSIKGGFGNFVDKSFYLEKFKAVEENATHYPYVIFEENGEERLYSHSHLTGYENYQDLGWFLIISKNTVEVFKPLNIIIESIAIVSVLSICLAFLLAFVLSGYLTKTIKKLLLGTEIIEKGDLNHKVGIKSKDEIGQLSRSFDKMIDSIKKSRAEVEEKVTKQTKEMKSKAEDLKNQQSAVINILEDVEEEKKKAEVAKIRLDFATKSANIGVWDWDIVKNNIVWDENMFKLYGIKRTVDAVAYNVWQSGLHPDDMKVTVKLLNDAIKGNAEYNTKFRVIWPDKSIHHVRAFGMVVKDKDGKPANMIGINFDITKEHLIDQAKTEFVSLASHQLRTPLSAINWYSEMLLAGDAGKLSAEQKNFVDEIYAGNQRMVNLVNALLNVSRIELGTLAIDPKMVDFSEIAKSVIAELKQLITEKKIKVIEKYDSKLPKIKADPNVVRIIFQNLLTNAVKYTPENGEVFVNLEKDKDNILIKIADTGYGIPNNQKDRIFEKMFRADNIKERDAGGTGLGLYLVKSIVDEAKGKIWFDSKENKGTVFYITLPLSGMEKREGTKTLNEEKI